MSYGKKLGIFCREPKPGEVKTRLTPPLTPVQACTLYEAFVRDLFGRLDKMKKTRATVFYDGEKPEKLKELVSDRYKFSPQDGADLGERMLHAFEKMLENESRGAVIIGSDSPDIPIQYIKRAFIKLKHKDVVLGPSSDGGYYLIGARSPHAGLFERVSWGESGVFGQTVQRVRELDLSLALLPMWYDVDTPDSLDLLRCMMDARRVEGSGLLPETEAALAAIEK
jgi:rSAM/selenodomain-associated transferase 1